MFKPGIIRKRVMAIVNEKIEMAEREYEECLTVLEAEYVKKQDDMLDGIVSRITAKII